MDDDKDKQLVARIRRHNDYYDILGINDITTCTNDDIKNAFINLSQKLHPDINKTPGSNEAYDKVCQAYECLSNLHSRRRYNLKIATRLLCWMMLFFGVLALIIYVICYTCFYDDLYPSYSMTMNDQFAAPMKTSEYDAVFYVQSTSAFDQNYPVRTHARAKIEKEIVKGYNEILERYCSGRKWVLLERPNEFSSIPPICDKLQSL